MENIDSKLNSNNPVLISQIFSRLVESLPTKTCGKQEFAYLKNKCLDENNLIGDVARVSILQLINNGTLRIDKVLADFVTSISTASNVTSLAKMIMSLLYLQLSQEVSEKEQCKIKQFQLVQHPLIKILQGESHYDLQMCIYKEIIQSCYRNLSVSIGVHTLYKPLYLYCICSPIIKVELSLLRQKLWAFLVKYEDGNNTDIVFRLCCWMQMQNKNCDLAASLLDELFQRQLSGTEPLKNLDYLILTQILVIHNMILNDTDCRLAIKTILHILPNNTFCHHNLSILILSKAVLVCSPLYLEDLLQLCFYFVNHNSCKPYSFLALKAVLLHWLASPCLLTQSAIKIGEDILKLNDHVCRDRPHILASRLSIDRFHYLTFCNPEIFLALELAIKTECTGDNEISSLLNSFADASVHYLKNCFTFLCGLFLHPKLSTDDKLNVLSMIVKCSSHYLEFLPTVLTLILYQLSNSEDNNMHFKLLQALPPMARVKENVPKVIATIQAISKRSVALGNFALRLMYDTWEIENKCYSALESVALQSPAFHKDDILERNITRAYIFNKLSEKRPELYGKDLVAHLSKILNECTTSEGSVPSALAIEGIRYLCKAEVIDIVTTWATLSPKFKTDTRVPVVKSLCELISEIPNLHYTQSYERLNDEVVQHLWNYVVKNDNEEVTHSALQALATFSIDLICLHIPEIYLDENYVKQNLGEDKRIVSGKTWLTFLTKCKSKDAARHFLTKLVTTEIDNYLKYVYQLKSQREPENYGGLPTHSIVRALGEFIKRNCQAHHWENTTNGELFVNCLQILSLKYSKPLPPLDWCFLQELVHIPAMKKYCLDLASHQAILSGSARRLIENYIVAVTENPTPEAAIHVYRNLKHLANSIQPMVLKPFFENSLHSALQIIEQDANFEQSLYYLKEVLDDEHVQDVNKHIIEDVLREMVFITDISSKAFPLYLNCISSFSQKGQEQIAKFNLDPFNQEEFSKIIKIRCHICKNTKSDTPLMWLNDIFGVAFKNNVKLDFYFDDLTSTIKRNLDHEESPTWLNELFGEIQAKVADRCEMTEIEYFCDVLAVAVVYFSGFFVILPKYDYGSVKYFFPAALTFLVDEPVWSICTTQILEWLHHMNTAESIPKEYQHIFGWTLSSLRHQEEFSKSSRWMKYLDCEIYTSNIL